ncbi:hypothetical protein ACFLRA_00635 [Bdellovibrionota bacterium]
MLRLFFTLLVPFLFLFPANICHADPVTSLERLIYLIARSDAADDILRVGFTSSGNNRISVMLRSVLGDAEEGQMLLRSLSENESLSHILLNRRLVEGTFAERHLGLYRPTGNEFARRLIADSRLRLFRAVTEWEEAAGALRSYGEMTGRVSLDQLRGLGIDSDQIFYALRNNGTTHRRLKLKIVELERNILRDPAIRASADPLITDELTDFVVHMGRVNSGFKASHDTLREGVQQLSEAIRVTKGPNAVGAANYSHELTTTLQEWLPRLARRFEEFNVTNELLREPLRVLDNLTEIVHVDDVMQTFRQWARSARLHDDLPRFFPEIGASSLSADLISDLRVIANRALVADNVGQALEAVVLSRSLSTVRKFKHALQSLKPRTTSSAHIQSAVDRLIELCRAEQTVLRRKIARFRFADLESQWVRARNFEPAFSIANPMTLEVNLNALDSMLDDVFNNIRFALRNAEDLRQLKGSIELADSMLKTLPNQAREAGIYPEMMEFLHLRHTLVQTLKDLVG